MKQFSQLFLVGCIAVVLAGCSSAPSRFYALNATAAGAGSPAGNYAVMVGPVFIPASVDRPQFTIQTAPNRIEIDEFNRWAAPLNDSIARVVSANLGTLLGTPLVATAPLPDFRASYRVTIRVERFESVRAKDDQNSEALVDALWVVRGPGEQHVISGHTLAREPAPGGSPDAFAIAHSRALAKLSVDIAGAIHAAAQQSSGETSAP